jgi:hypothetical protein
MKNICIIIYIKKLIQHISPLYSYSTFLRIVVSSYCTNTQKWYIQNDILWKDFNEIYQYFYGNSPKNVFPQQYGHDYYGQSNYDQKLEFDRHKMLYDSNLERDEYPQQYSHDL